MNLLHCVRIVIIAIVLLTSALLVLEVLLQYLISPILVLVVPSWETFFYDVGFYGAFPVQTYKSFNLTSPRISQKVWDKKCEDGYIFITPKGPSVPHKGPTILDIEGNLIWMSNDYQTSTNLKVQNYKGKPYLTIWSGQQAGTAGAGDYYMLDQSYNITHTVTPVGADLHGDLHEFKVTADGTALMTIYNKTTMDMRDIGRAEDAWIQDSIFQEVDIETGKLIFQWRASDHYTANESYDGNPLAGWFAAMPYDFFHINSVDKDQYGNFLISSRHMHTLTYIDGKTGDIIWILGGHRNDFEDVSEGGKRVDFSWQHDARWLSRDEGTITLFDNRQAGVVQTWGPFSRGMLIQIDEKRRNVKFLQQFESLQHTLAPSQGSMEQLPESRNFFIGWGHSAAYSEFSADGKLLCETHFGASWLDWWGRVVSYRAFKTKTWVGKPDYPPSVAIKNGKLFVSWNGATEVRGWQLEGRGLEDEEWRALDVIDKAQFEESFALANIESYAFYRVAALGRDWANIRHSEEIENVKTRNYTDLVIKATVASVFAVLGWWCWHRFVRPEIRTRMGWTAYEYRKL